MNLLYMIFFGLSKMIYSAIPALYRAFSFFATNEFFDIDNDIKEIWAHLYVLLSVLVLFAIAIKLINAIVNPDILTDNKKGVKKAYFSAIIAVFLTILTPYIFTLLVHIEKDVVDNHIIEKQLFGYSESTDGGQTIAWTALTSFIDLNQLAAETEYELPTDTIQSTDNRIFTFNKNIDEGINEIEAVKPWNHIDTVQQHPILMAIAGFLIAYELVILVMDTALRSIKLGLLQIITPIILGAYIFKSDILKNWVKEYVKTYTQVFLLIVAMSFLTQILRLLPNILVGQDFGGNWLVVGIINALAIFATLRLVKQIIPLINSIFGSHIQAKGGIKGRLGEMAVVGGLAQKAWGTLGTGAKNLGKLTAKGVGYTAGAVPYGLATGISRLATGEGKGLSRLKSGTAFKDLSGVRKVRGIGSAVGAAAKSAVTTGDVGKITESFNKGLTSTATPTEKARRLNLVNERLNDILTNSETGNSVTSETNINNKMAANERLSNGIQRVAGKKVLDAHDNYQKAYIKASIAKSIDSDNKAINTLMKDRMNVYAAGSTNQKLLADAISAYEGDGNTRKLHSFIDSNRHLFDDATLNALIGENGKLIAKDRKIQYLLDDNNKLDLTQSDKDNIQRGSSAVSFLASTLDANSNSSKANLDVAVSGAMLNDLEKMEVDKYISSVQDVNASLAFAIGRKDDDNKLDRSNVKELQNINFYQSPNNVSSSSASGSASSDVSVNTSSSQSSSSQSASSSTTGSSDVSYNSTSPDSLHVSEKNQSDYFTAQNEARIAELENKDVLTDSEKAELANLTGGAVAERLKSRNAQRNAAQEWSDNEGTLDE